MPLIPQAGPPVGKAREESNLSFYLKRQGNGGSINDKEEKISIQGLAIGTEVAIEKHQERSKRMNHEQGSPQNQTVFDGPLHTSRSPALRFRSAAPQGWRVGTEPSGPRPLELIAGLSSGL